MFVVQIYGRKLKMKCIIENLIINKEDYLSIDLSSRVIAFLLFFGTAIFSNVAETPFSPLRLFVFLIFSSFFYLLHMKKEVSRDKTMDLPFAQTEMLILSMYLFSYLMLSLFTFFVLIFIKKTIHY